jgi:glycosyltransferase involved in cell wall biosynthesis
MTISEGKRSILANSDCLRSRSSTIYSSEEIAVVIPVFKQPGLLPEALESVFQQDFDLRVRSVVVNDGCPLPETHRVGLAYASAYPDRVHYIRRKNGGLSAARNAGIDFVLAAWPQCRAIYLLDADNRLYPPFLRKAWALLESSGAEIGWVYPDVDMFGFHQNCAVNGSYSRLMHILENFCEAGSLVRRELFESGLRFDETMRAGFEDWDFWLSAGEEGFVGKHLPQSGFRYRRRAESMLTQSERMRESILTYMREKHHKLLRPSSLIELEVKELPRTAVFPVEHSGARFLVDPAQFDQSSPIDIRETARCFVEATINPYAEYFPPILCFSSIHILRILRDCRIDRYLFWEAERLLRSFHFVAIYLELGTGSDLSISVAEDRSLCTQAHVVFGQWAICREAVWDPSAAWIGTMQAEAPSPLVNILRVVLPRDIDRSVIEGAGSAVQHLLDIVSAFRTHTTRWNMLPSDWRKDWRTPRADGRKVYQFAANCGAVFPHLTSRPARNIGFVLPLFGTGGVDKVVLNYAIVMKSRGYRPHLFVTGVTESKAWLPPEVRDTFDSVSFFSAPHLETADWSDLFFGTGALSAALPGNIGDWRGLLATMDVVMNTHALGGHGLMAALRRFGIKTFIGLHLVERSAQGYPSGNPHIALAYEHVYDRFVVISDQLRAWCIGQGVPRDKLLVVRNAPAFSPPDRIVADAMEDRFTSSDRPLRILFLGRLDAQKGLDRVAEIAARTRGDGFEWRVVGRSILGDSSIELIPDWLHIEPAAGSEQELCAVYAWADVVLLTSRFEGVPLTILEAQRFGCTVVATDVGAVSEIVTDGENGFLVAHDQPEHAIVEMFLLILSRLSRDRSILMEIGKRAAAHVSHANWDANMSLWIEDLEQMFLTDKR